MQIIVSVSLSYYWNSLYFTELVCYHVILKVIITVANCCDSKFIVFEFRCSLIILVPQVFFGFIHQGVAVFCRGFRLNAGTSLLVFIVEQIGINHKQN